MTDQHKRNFADLSMSDFLMLAWKLCEEQGYITPDGEVTPLGEAYLAALVEEEAERCADMDVPDMLDTSYEAMLERARGDHDWTELN